MAVGLLDRDAVSNGHDRVEVHEVSTCHGGCQRIHKAQHIVERSLGGLGVAAFANKERIHTGSNDPLFRNEIAEVLNDFLSFLLVFDYLQRTLAGESVKFLHYLLHEETSLKMYFTDVSRCTGCAAMNVLLD